MICYNKQDINYQINWLGCKNIVIFHEKNLCPFVLFEVILEPLLVNVVRRVWIDPQQICLVLHSESSIVKILFQITSTRNVKMVYHNSLKTYFLIVKIIGPVIKKVWFVALKTLPAGRIFRLRTQRGVGTRGE